MENKMLGMPRESVYSPGLIMSSAYYLFFGVTSQNTMRMEMF